MPLVGWPAYKLDIRPSQIKKIAELNKQSTLVFLPNHRSYLDPLILRSALQDFLFRAQSITYWVGFQPFLLPYGDDRPAQRCRVHSP